MASLWRIPVAALRLELRHVTVIEGAFPAVMQRRSELRRQVVRSGLAERSRRALSFCKNGEEEALPQKTPLDSRVNFWNKR